MGTPFPRSRGLSDTSVWVNHPTSAMAARFSMGPPGFEPGTNGL
jgi:hypothetical protein